MHPSNWTVLISSDDPFTFEDSGSTIDFVKSSIPGICDNIINTKTNPNNPANITLNFRSFNKNMTNPNPKPTIADLTPIITIQIKFTSIKKIKSLFLNNLLKLTLVIKNSKENDKNNPLVIG
ncbi:hypothetical protein NBRC110019_05910 [Neptunitalea chrysea]|uniref:Uncharacterized protein n=1 Tax=Neptunitalea chrysea TaxID=1647581 RepID=A0A9W6B578_9FLAO|nr:hypothetical protein NBRC110019_05910 [Neptunitalea chrysea]